MLQNGKAGEISLQKTSTANELAAKVISLVMIVVSLFLMNVNWIYSPVLSPYEGIFKEAAEISDEIASSVSEQVNVVLNTTEIFKNLEDGSLGPSEASETVSAMWTAVTELKGYNDEFDLGILKDADVRKLLVIFAAFQILYLAVLIAGLIQIIVTLAEGARAKIPVFLIAQGMMAAVFLFVAILGNTYYTDLKFSFTPAPFSAVLLAIPQPYWRKFLEGIRIFWTTLLAFSRTEAGRRVRMILMVTFLIVVVTGTALGTYIYYAYRYRKSHERRTDDFTTSTTALYSEEKFKRTLRSYGFTDKSERRKIVKSSYIIPGLKTTRTLKDNEEFATCTSMTPQGVCIAGPYLLVSAYCASGNHNSVIYVINRSLHTFVKEIILSGTPHVGGITYDRDQENIWFCDYENDSKTAYVCAFSMESMENYELTEAKKPINYIFANPIYSLKRTSFLDYNQQKLYIGHYGKSLAAYTSIQAFSISQKNGLFGHGCG